MILSIRDCLTVHVTLESVHGMEMLPYHLLPDAGTDKFRYQLRVYLYQARDMYGSDRSGLSGKDVSHWLT